MEKISDGLLLRRFQLLFTDLALFISNLGGEGMAIHDSVLEDILTLAVTIMTVTRRCMSDQGPRFGWVELNCVLHALD